MPGGEAQDLGADDRRQDGSQPHDQDQAGEVARRRRSDVQVAHDRPGDDNARGAGESLHKAKADEDRRHRRGGAQERCQDVRGDADQQRAAPAETVAQGPGEDLPEREANEARGQCELDHRLARRQVPSNRRKGGQVHVDRERPECGQAAEQHEDPCPLQPRPNRRHLGADDGPSRFWT